MQVTDQFPDPARTDAGVVVSSEWVSDRPREVADAIVEAWRQTPWPDGLLSYSIYLATDGDLIRHYSQWTDEAAFAAFDRRPRIGLIDAARPGIVRRDHAEYRLYRGDRSDDGRLPGAIAAVRVDTDNDEVARAWVDAIFAALEHDQHLPAGGIGAFFHISTDGKRVLNYAEWESAEAHRKALAASGGRISSGSLWDKARTMPGVRQISVTRYHLHSTMTR